MGKNRNYDREVSLIDRLKKENGVLKRDNLKLRRENDRLKNLQHGVVKQVEEYREPKKTKKDWTCFGCGKGILRLHLFPRRDGNYYYRKCTLEECGKQTTLKKYTSDVEE